MRHRFLIALLALLPIRVAASGEEPAKAPAFVPFPKDGLDEPSVGIPGLPLELKDGNGDIHRRKASPFQKGVGGIVRWGAQFEYPYADAAVEKTALAEGRAIGIEIVGFPQAGLAHLWLFERLITMTPEEHEADAPTRRWNDGLARTSLPGLFFQGTLPTAVGLTGIVRHTVVDVTWDRRPFRDKGGEEPAAMEAMRKRTTATCEAVIRAVREAPPAESTSGCNIAKIAVESIAPSRSGFPRSRLTASTPNRSLATLWVEGIAYTNAGASGPSASITAEISSLGNLNLEVEEARIFCIDDGPIFHFVRINKFRYHPILGYVWPK